MFQFRQRSAPKARKRRDTPLKSTITAWQESHEIFASVLLPILDDPSLRRFSQLELIAHLL